jgi:hypothetical protein
VGHPGPLLVMRLHHVLFLARMPMQGRVRASGSHLYMSSGFCMKIAVLLFSLDLLCTTSAQCRAAVYGELPNALHTPRWDSLFV